MSEPERVSKKTNGSPKEKPKGAPALVHLKETGQLPEGYYRDAKGVVRKLPPVAIDPALKEVDLLMAMRFVMLNPAACDTTESQKLCRELREKSPATFLDRYEELDRQERAKKVPVEEKPVSETQGDKDTRELLDRLLERHAEASARSGTGG